MATDIWNGNDNWATALGDWSLGAPPTASTNAIIQTGTAYLTTAGVAAGVTVQYNAALSINSGGTLSATSLTNYGYVYSSSSGGGDNVTLSAALVNRGNFYIGNSSLSSNVTVSAASFVNTGNLYLTGSSGTSSSPSAKLTVSGAQSAAVTGTLQVSGNATLSFGSGSGFTSIASGATLEVDSAQANIKIGAGAQNSGLANLASNNGTLTLRGNTGYGAGGVQLTTTTSFTDSYYVYIDAYSGSEGGSNITFGGALTVAGPNGHMFIGNTGLSATTTVSATALIDTGHLELQGNSGSASTPAAKLVISGAANAGVTGYLRVGGNATLSYGTGAGLTSVTSAGWLELDGSLASVKIGSGTQYSGLAGLASNAGYLLLRGNTGYGSGGVQLTTTSAFLNTGNVYIDYYGGGEGGANVTFGGALTNTNYFYIGNTNLSANTTVKATSFFNNGHFELQGNAGAASTPVATLAISGTANDAVTGFNRIGGNAVLSFATGGLTSVASGGWLELDGSLANIKTGSGAQNSGLSGLTTNAGNFVLRGGTGYGGGGVSLTTTTSFTNAYYTYIDSYGGGEGGGVVTFGGALTNNYNMYVGNTSLSSSVTVNATSFVDNGHFELQGNSGASSTPVATLAISGAATASVTGYLRIGGNAVLSYASGAGINAVAAGGWLELDGSLANVKLTTGGANSALANLNRNSGNLVFRGNTGYGGGGVSLTTTVQFSNYGTAYFDGYSGGDGGGNVTFGGGFFNLGTAYIGNQYLSASTTVNATTLQNTGSLTIQGSSGATGPVATLALSGASSLSVTNAIRVGGNAVLSYGSGSGFTSVGVSGSLELDGANANVKAGSGGQNSGIAALATNNGLILLRGNTGYGTGGVSWTTTGGLVNNGRLWIDYYGNDGSSVATIGGQLNNTGTVVLGNVGLGSSTTLNVGSLVNAGSLTLQGATGATGPSATLNVAGIGSQTVTNTIRVGGNAKLDLAAGSGFANIANTGYLELDGQNANIASGAGAQNSGISGLTNNQGTVLIRGNEYYGTGGVTWTTTLAYYNYGTTNIEYYGGDGGSNVTFGGLLVNQGSMTIGNSSLSVNTSVTATGLANSGAITLIGNSNSAGSSANLTFTGASPGVVVGYFRLEGVSSMSFGTGNGLTSVLSTGFLELDGGQTGVKVGLGSQNSGLSKLAANAGLVLFRGNATASGGVNITTTTGYTNTGTTRIDYYYADGGSNIAFGGGLTNQGELTIGSYNSGYLSAADLLSATSLTNSAGSLNLAGYSSTNTATVSISGAANNSATVNVGANAFLNVTGGYTQSGNVTNITGTLTASSYTQTGGVTTVASGGTLAATTINDRGGSVVFNSALNSGSSATSFTLQNGGSLTFNAGVSSAQTVTFQDATDVLSLGAAGSFNGTIAGFVNGDAIDLLNQTATSLTFTAGTLNVFNGATQVAALHMTGSYTTSSFTLTSDNHGGSLIFV